LKKAIPILLVLVAFLLVVGTCGSLEYFSENWHTPPPANTVIRPTPNQQPDTPPPATPDNGTQDDPPDDLTPDEIIIYQPGMYIIGIDLPEGIYVAVIDDSGEASVTIRENQTAFTDKPKIIITSRYTSSNGAFSPRPTYVNAVKQGGGEPIFPSDDNELAAILRDGKIENADILAERYDGLVLTGGGDVASHFFNQEHHPASAAPDETLDIAELELVRAFVRAGKPILGVCRGMQVINIAMGGELIQDIPDLLGIPAEFHKADSARHDIFVRPGTWLHSMYGSKINTNSFHHQAVWPIAPGFSVVAYTGPVIEAIERGNVLGVQFHPEQMLDEGMLQFFRDFIYRCSHKNIVVDVFASNTIIDAKNNQFVDVVGAKMYSLEHSSRLFETMFETYGHFSEGMYLTGTHIPAGEYTLAAVDESIFSSYMIYDGLTHESLLDHGNIPAEGVTVTLKNGQYIKLIYATIKMN